MISLFPVWLVYIWVSLVYCSRLCFYSKAFFQNQIETSVYVTATTENSFEFIIQKNNLEMLYSCIVNKKNKHSNELILQTGITCVSKA